MIERDCEKIQLKKEEWEAWKYIARVRTRDITL